MTPGKFMNKKSFFARPLIRSPPEASLLVLMLWAAGYRYRWGGCGARARREGRGFSVVCPNWGLGEGVGTPHRECHCPPSVAWLSTFQPRCHQHRLAAELSHAGPSARQQWRRELEPFHQETTEGAEVDKWLLVAPRTT